MSERETPVHPDTRRRAPAAHVTLDAVAREAGVSLATASRALNGTTRVRDDLRGRVRAAADLLGYIPNAHAQALASPEGNRTVGLICHDVGDPYFAGIASGVMRAAAEQDLLVMLASTFREPAREIAYVSMLRAQRARAILLIGSGFQDRAWERAMDAELEPYVRAGGRVAVVSRHRSMRVDTVQPENRAGAAALAASLVALGHRDFAVLSGPPELTTVADRLAGFREGLARAGITLERVVRGAFTREGGHAAARQLLDSGGPRPTCVFAVTDVMAVGALAALREAGVRVPEDMSLAGFDDIPVVREVSPPLTTVALPLTEMGEQVIALALRTPSGAGRSRVLRIEGNVVLRGSTGAPPGS
ncbi:LacI family transcriptional regulator [Streptomyces sp. ARC12]|nr:MULTISPECIES: LacI family DNA-binding transcriptional regulator [Streptomyces]MDQ0694471.1 LacI family transcriptional regulator [Streptomyces sp. W4I9-2]MDX3484478.1 LacI family DNA-binding transcriptional regulator [Streptomyces sp. ID05-18]WIY80088.1 LacI family DNA-binding transcriptional regulator [Streptomyces anulatus]WSC65415.1 LacI family transcriptional regulator [Streptomyces anulatus]WTC75134.1 LacI family transcriptional regulator [Streptomyces anulatus]